MAIRAAVKRALDYAQIGEREFGILLNAETGEVLDEAEGGEDHITLNWPENEPDVLLVMVHSHPNVMPPSHVDWQALARHPHLESVIAVDVERFYRLDKFEKSWIRHFSGDSSMRVAESFLNHFGNALLDAKLPLDALPSDDEIYPFVMDANRWMCDNYDVEFTIEEHTP